MKVAGVRRRLLAMSKREGSIDAFAKKVGVSRNYMSMAIRGQRVPDGKILAFLGLRREITFVKDRK
jgi:hypothetical protein